MKLSMYVPTKNGSSRNPPAAFANLLQHFRELADELVVVVDDTTTDDTFEVAKRYTDHVFPFSHDPLFIEHRAQSFYRCTGDWIFWCDDDDRLSVRWTRAMLEHLMAARSVTHYWVPSRFFVSDDTYLSTAPYIGHYAVQLYRNIESIAIVPAKLHQQMAIAGEPAYLAGLYNDAMDFAWHDRPTRENKLRMYDESYDEWGTGFDQTRFYLYEDYYFETRRVDDPKEPQVMAPINESGLAPGVHVRFVDCPEEMTAGQTYWLTVRIANNSDSILLPQSEFLRWGTLQVSYRWLGEKSAPAEEALRTPFPARILPGRQHDALIKVKAPVSHGTYRLQIDILEEERWLGSDAPADNFQARKVEIKPLIWPPRPLSSST